MKKLSIKWKVTLLYTGMVAVILGIALTTVYLFVGRIGLSATEEEIQGSVTGFVGQINFEDDGYYLSGDTEFYEDGVMFCVYDNKGRLLYGSMPVDFPSDTVLQSHKMRVINSKNKQWMVYDYVKSYGKNNALWVRGITSIHSMEHTMDIAARGLLLAFPAVILLIGFLGYRMVRRAFLPVEQLRESAEEISEGTDLTKRLPMPKAKDEIYYLTESFNEMFARLQTSFDHEKQFTGDVSHELRTPVAVLISQCEYVLEHMELNEEQRGEVEIILNQSQRISQLISQLLMIVRGEQFGDTLEFEPVDVVMLTEMVLEELEPKAKERNMTLTMKATDDLMVQGDQTLLLRMMMNLVGNGIRYGRDGGYVHVDLWREGQEVCGKISDNGIGIGKEHLDKIWDRFYRVDKSRTGNGTGLGLSMVKWIVELHKGKIFVDSKEGEGTVFSFRFPQ